MSKYENIKVAVAMATCNTDSKMLSQAVDSILNQTHENFVFYIVNDSGENLSQLKNIHDDRIVIIEHKEKLGLAQSMNEILDRSKEKYIFRMDADDISLPDRLETQIDFMEKHRNIGISSMFSKTFGAEDRFRYIMWSKSDDLKALLIFMNIFVHSCVVLRNEVFQNTGVRYNASFSAAQDYDLWSRCIDKTNMAIIPKVGILYRVHSNQISASRGYVQKDFANNVQKANLHRLGLDDVDYKYLDMLVYPTLIDDFNEFSGAIVKIINANGKKCVYNQKSLFNVISYFYMRACVKTHNILFAIKYSKITRNMMINPSNITVSISKIKILQKLNRQMK